MGFDIFELSTQGILKVKPCGLAYWLLSASQLPLAIGLTAWIALQHSSKSHAAKPSESNEVSFLQNLSRIRGTPRILPPLGARSWNV